MFDRRALKLRQISGNRRSATVELMHCVWWLAAIGGVSRRKKVLREDCIWLISPVGPLIGLRCGLLS